jgi:hypothetical protein
MRLNSSRESAQGISVPGLKGARDATAQIAIVLWVICGAILFRSTAPTGACCLDVCDPDCPSVYNPYDPQCCDDADPCTDDSYAGPQPPTQGCVHVPKCEAGETCCGSGESATCCSTAAECCTDGVCVFKCGDECCESGECCSDGQCVEECPSCETCDPETKHCFSCDTLGLCCDGNGDCVSECPNGGCCLDGQCIEQCPACTECVDNQCVTCASKGLCCDQEGCCIGAGDCPPGQCLVLSPEEVCLCVPGCPFCEICQDGICASCESAGQCCFGGECVASCPNESCCYGGSCVANCPDCMTCQDSTCVSCVSQGQCCDNGSCVVSCTGGKCCNNGVCGDCDACEECDGGTCKSCQQCGFRKF